MKTPSPHLHQLIHSLSGREIAYFKRLAATLLPGDTKTYLRLFEAIQAQAHYDEAALKARFADESFARHLYKTKTYLYDTLLRALTQYHRNHSHQARLEQMLAEIRILFQRGLYNQCAQRIRKARNRAEKSRQDAILLQLQTWELRLIGAKGFQGTSRADLEQRFDAQRKVLADLRATQAYTELQLQLFRDFYTKGYPGEGGWQEAFQALTAHPELQEPPAGYWAQHRYHNIMELQGTIRQDWAQVVAATEARLALFDAAPEVIHSTENHFHGYIVLLNNVLIHQSGARDFEKMAQSLTRVRAMRNAPLVRRSKLLQATVHALAMSWELAMRNLQGEADADGSVAARIETELKRHRRHISDFDRRQIDCHLATLHLVAGRYRAALERVNRVLNELSFEHNPSQYMLVTGMRIVLHFELGNYELLENLLKSARRHIATKGAVLPDHALLFAFMESWMDARDEGEKRASRDAFARRAAVTPSTTSMPDSLIFFDHLAWLRAKTEGRTLAEVIRNQR